VASWVWVFGSVGTVGAPNRRVSKELLLSSVVLRNTLACPCCKTPFEREVLHFKRAEVPPWQWCHRLRAP